ncbi:hypothetical protein PVK06_005443 [Gossypium arboreum]|uniref:Zinc finger MYM-type protein 1-like n=1 Tax=Gossypium arboreum TaxID=29729 RepID=A0ABR0QUL7_GOSAR|nr:hypothetical protein PVK06_005443 [Gossypium arboreum]
MDTDFSHLSTSYSRIGSSCYQILSSGLYLKVVPLEDTIKHKIQEIKDIASLALEKVIYEVLLPHCLNVNDIYGQGYDGASNMRGEWNSLQALFAKKCRFAYNVHYFVHRLQLTLVVASKEVIPICQFFSYLTSIINLVTFSSKQHDQLRDIEASHITKLIDNGELETGKGKNQV